MKKSFLRILGVMALMSLMSCEIERYDTGDGDYSYMRADFAMVTTGEAKSLRYALTDEAESLTFSPPLDCSWATTPDSTYRALVYYNRKKEDLPTVKGISAAHVMTLKLIKKKTDDMKMDPLTVESAWISANGKFLNLGLYVKTGKDGDSGKSQILGMVRDTIVALDNGSCEHQWLLFHHQNGVPENYSTRLYTSVALDSVGHGDRVSITAHTYEGMKTLVLQVP